MPIEVLASYSDINVQLPTTFAVDANTEGIDAASLDAIRIVRGSLLGVFSPTVIAGWDSPTHTPELIRGVAARLIAALMYSRLFAAQDSDTPDFANQKYRAAMQTLKQIRSGELILLDVDNTTLLTAGWSNTDFYPNAEASGPIFTLDMEF